MKIYIAASWKHQHAVEMLTHIIQGKGHEVKSFVENSFGEGYYVRASQISFEDWMQTEDANKAFDFDSGWAMRWFKIRAIIALRSSDKAFLRDMAWEEWEKEGFTCETVNILTDSELQEVKDKEYKRAIDVLEGYEGLEAAIEYLKYHE